jgi:hypothetical protein
MTYLANPGTRGSFIAIIIATSLAMVPDVQAQQAVGDAERIVNIVTGSAVGGRRLADNDPVYQSEVVSADAASRGELQLLDGSRVIVGENASISMDDFVVAENSFSQGTVSIARGAFRFISGERNSNLVFETPLSTIGVRGTIFDLYVETGGLTRLVLINGRVQACTRSGNCVLADRACDIVEIRGPDEIEEIPFLRSRNRDRAEEARLFNLTEQQFRHSAQWRAPEIACNARAAEEASQNRAGSNDGPNGESVNISPPEPEPEPDPPSNGEGEGGGQID